MILRGGPGLGAGMSLLARSGLVRHPRAAAVLRRGGIATAVGLAALRSPDRAVLVRGDTALTGRDLDAAVAATARAIAERWPEGSRLGLRGDGGLEFVIALAAAGVSGIDVMPIGPRHGAEQVTALAGTLDAVVDARGLVTLPPVGSRYAALRPVRRPGRLLVLSTGTRAEPSVTTRGRLGWRGLLQLADADRRLRMPSGAVLVLAPPDHGHGLTMALAGLVRGRTVVLASGLKPVEQARLAREHRAASVTGVPAQLARFADAAPDALDGVRLVVSGSSRLTDDLRARLSAGGARVLDCYGSTETGTVAIEGRPLAGVRIEVGADRRILITSPLGGAAVSPGDVGRIAAGRLIVEGRVGALVDSGGELVAPERVAETLRALPGVVAARVVVEEDDLLGSRLRADVTVSDSALDAAALTHALTEQLGRAAVPREFRIEHTALTLD